MLTVLRDVMSARVVLIVSGIVVDVQHLLEWSLHQKSCLSGVMELSSSVEPNWQDPYSVLMWMDCE